MIGAFVQWPGGPRRSPWTGYVIDENGCHIWVGTVLSNGYGQITDGKRRYLVHRLRYEREVGPIPPGLVLDHFVCNNPTCCNPAHVRPVTQWENNLRSNAPSSLNLAKTYCKWGHPLEGDNLGHQSRGRRCRACTRESDRVRRQRPEVRARRLAYMREWHLRQKEVNS